MDARTILHNAREVSARFAAERRERQQRQDLVATATGRIAGSWAGDLLAVLALRALA